MSSNSLTLSLAIANLSLNYFVKVFLVFVFLYFVSFGHFETRSLYVLQTGLGPIL